MPLVASPDAVGSIHPRFGPPRTLEHHGEAWITIGPTGVNCWAGPAGSVLFRDRAAAVAALHALGFAVSPDGVVIPAPV